MVIDRADGAVKMFTGTTGVYLGVKELNEDTEDWGDPSLYDIKVTRTEEPGMGYYKVRPASKSPITKEEKILIKASKIDLMAELIREKDQKASASELENAPEDEINIPDDLGDSKEEAEATEDGEALPF